jgi:head-tail adaptor
VPVLMPTIGRLRDRVAFYAVKDTAARPSGHKPVEYEALPYATLWAEVVATGGGLATQGGEVRTGVAYRVRVRYSSRNPLQGELGVWNGKNLYVQLATDMDGRRRFVELSCKEGPPG